MITLTTRKAQTYTSVFNCQNTGRAARIAQTVTTVLKARKMTRQIQVSASGKTLVVNHSGLCPQVWAMWKGYVQACVREIL